MSHVISNTSPLLYLYRIGKVSWLSQLFDEIWIPPSVVRELHEGQQRGYDVPNPREYTWLKVVEPRSIPSEWLSLDLGAGELATLSLALEYPKRILLLDDELARRITESAGLTAWGTLRILLMAKKQGWVESVDLLIDQLEDSGMWISEDIRERILKLAGER